ncbi:doublecortin domain-containing protein 2B [Spea bombifrons]|uniref:doublecortin domain-containing protein 2B n=1 Tax=Spea bombifrons TaxID=233779 RepID=UPI00234BDBED|nr:doublecortin domain-containing protein 2B [Spea bombifrons]
MSSPLGVQLVPHAKNVLVFRNGDPFHMGRRMVVNEKQFVTFESFLNEVTSSIQAPAAIRNIYTPRNGHRIDSISDLQNKSQYVAAGTEKFRKLDYLHTEVKPPAVPKSRHTQQAPRKVDVSARRRKDTQLPCIIHVFRNGDLRTPPFRVLLSPSILKEWELVLTVLTQKANLLSGAVRKVCTLDGVSLACGAELVSGQYYVVVGSEKYKCLPYEELLLSRSDKAWNNGRRRFPKVGDGKVHNISQGGASDSALMDSPVQDGRRVRSTDVDGKSSVPNHQNREEEAIFYAKPVRIHHAQKQTIKQDTNVQGVFKVKKTRPELEGAQEVKEDKYTRVEVPVDQRAAEVVQEENIPKNKRTHPTEDRNSKD